MISMNNAQKEVQNGRVLLDRYFPTWHQDIDLSTLDIRSPWNCILGQVGRKNGMESPYTNMQIAIGINDGSRYGFASDDIDMNDLKREWENIITELREEETDIDIMLSSEYAGEELELDAVGV